MWEGQQQRCTLASQLRAELAVAHWRLSITSCERLPFWAAVGCRPFMKSSGADDRHPCVSPRARYSAIVASQARPPALTTGEEVTSVTWSAACALYILWLGCPPPGASRDATPRLGRAVVIDQWEVDKAEYGRHRRSADNDFRQTAPATGSSPDNNPDICEYLRLMLFQNHYGSGGLRATWRPLLRVVTSVDKAT